MKPDIHFLSLEPLVGRVGELELEDIEGVMSGGESGLILECKVEWVREVRDQRI